MSNFLVAEDLHKSFGFGGEDIHVLRGLDLELHEGERLAIVGESGVGKSTLLHILGTLDHPSRGHVTYRGTDLSSLDDSALSDFRNREIGFIFQFHYLLPDFNALENVMLPALIQRWEWEKAEHDAVELLELVGLGDRMAHRPGKLSGGEQQRVAVARSVILRPRLLLADEPTGDLDPHTGEEIENLLFRLNEEKGVAFIVATHNRQFAARMGRHMELRGGRLYAL
ncbi:MAG TPA: ABC transporter ATP-binding protein [Candidatus Binatia bacterium]|jgi:lipoprotein-releasing system ATP-binding protein|nr:ABC transporter ATP-binding protein [Candidatus Binatia bacterium]